MERKQQTYSPPAGSGRGRTKTVRHSRWLGLLVMFVLQLGFSQTAKAVGYQRTYDVANITQNWAKPHFYFDLCLGENNGDYSYWGYWNGDHRWVLYLDGVELCTSANLGLNKGNTALGNVASDYDQWYTQYTDANGNWIGVWNPHWGVDKQVWAYICIVPKYSFIGQPHTITIKGRWHDNDKDKGVITMTVPTNNASMSVPEMSLTRSNGKINYNASLSAVGSSASAFTWGLTLFYEKPGSQSYKEPTTDNSLGGLKTTESTTEMSLSYNADNYKAYKVYPRLSASRKSAHVIAFNPSRSTIADNFFKDYDVVNVPGYPRATGLTAEGQKWAKTVNLSWNSEVYDSNNCDTNGKWYVFRKNLSDNTVEIVGSEIAYNTRTFTDNSATLDYSTPYTYYVSFVPNGWTVNSWTDADGLWTSKDFTLKREYQFKDFTAEGNDENIVLDWKLESFSNANNSNPYDVVLQRSVNNNTSWTDLYTQTINSPSIISGNYTDADVSNPCTNYYYRLMVMAQDTTFYSNEEVSSITGESKVTSIAASRGTYTGRVRIQWEAEQYGTAATYYTVKRRLFGSGDDRWVTLYTTNGTASSYNYQDDTAQPGDYYEYQVISETKCQADNSNVQHIVTTDGFCMARGVVSGRISYGTGTAVEAARVVLKPSSSSGTDVQSFYSLHLQGIGDGVSWPVPQAIKTTSPYTIQYFLRPETEDASRTANAVLLEEKGTSTALLQLSTYDATNQRYQLILNGNASGVYVKPNEFTLITLRYDGSQYTLSTFDTHRATASYSVAGHALSAESLHFGYSSDVNKPQFKGYLDEIRVYSRALPNEEIVSFADHTLAGNEDGLVAYIPLDEGVQALKKAYDYSKTAGAANENHGDLAGGSFDTTIPDSNQFGLLGYTDNQGNYVVRGVPFNGDGTNYSVTPVMNSHEFSPEKQSRFVSASSLVHSGVDFTDISSFEVSGIIRYSGTNIPVDSVKIFVDGRQASRNNEIVVTNDEGKFTVDVPIGKHYISVSKDGHTFEKDGRIPYDPTGLNETTYEFVKDESGFVFWDNTLVPVAGRVVGGAIESEKLLGFADIDEYKSKNTIGQARITLEIPDTRYMLNAYEDTEGLVSNGFRPIAENRSLTYPTGVTATGEGYRTGGTQEDQAKRVVITTDAETGDFAVLLPPLDYKVTSVQMVNNQADDVYKFNPQQLPRIDASHPETVLKDSIPTEDGGFRYFDYVAAMKLTLHTNPVLSVRQKNGSKNLLPEGVFGEAIGEYEIPTTKEVRTADLYTVNTNGTVNYTFGYPIFKEMASYTFDIEGYELYTNYDKADDDDDRVTKVPLKETVVTISNPMSAGQEVRTAAPENGENIGEVVNLKENQLQLDSLGKATYTWTAGLPYTLGNYTRTMNMTYNNGEGDYSWQGLEAIIFGDLPKGSNFTTKGPSIVEMILHDPYGDSSFATWETGTVTIRSKETLRSEDDDKTFSTNMHLGPKIELENGLFTQIQTEIESIVDFSGGYQITNTYDTLNVYTTTIETTRAISTSSDPDMVGADADIYIGKSVNLIYGKTRQVGLKADVNGNPYVSVDDACSVNEKLSTNFAFTQYQIENILIPGLELLRNDYLITVPDMETATNQTDSTIYVTNLLDTDEDFGKPGTYKVLAKTEGLDMVSYYNDEIQSWKNTISQNEAYKDSLFHKPDIKTMKNVSFGGGVEVNESSTTSYNHMQNWTHSHTYYVNYSHDLGGTFNGVGIDFSYESHCSSAKYNGGNGSDGHTEEDENSSMFSYTLADSGADDSFSMDVYEALNNHGPIFRTRGGQSSCPYEGQEVTKYYKPGTELSAATMQIERPSIDCKTTQLTGVPTGGKAQFELLLGNESDTNTDCYFNLIPVDGANPKGALLSLPTGPIGNGRTVLVPAGPNPVKMILTLEQGNLDVTDYEDIEIALTSTCQNDPTSIHGAISSSIKLSAHFVPASTPVDMTIDKTVINTNNKDEDLSIRVTGFDRNFQGLKRVDIQYMAPGAQSWSLLRSYIPNNDVRENNSQELLPANGVIEVALNMNSSNWLDGIYQFRAQSAAIYGGNPVTSESEVLTLVKDVNRPQLFGLASPTDGVLNADDMVSVTFNEDIQQALLTDNNFVVSGVLNGAQVKHDVALSAQNTDYAAKTEANINLARKDFSADMWVRVTDAGDIFCHGNGDERFKLSVDDNNKLVVTIGNESYTSTNAIEKNTWTFLAFTYKFENGNSLLNARAITDNYTREMFTNQAVADYAGTGGITLGKGFSGAIHELTLWDKAREMNEAQAEMHITKKPSTPNLIGYWKMDEGNGLTATDYARNRHLTLPNNTWYLNNDNKAVSLNGSNSLKLDITECSALSTEDYAMEMWFKGAKADNTAVSTLFSASEQSVSMGFNSTGALTMTANGVDTEISKNDYLDNTWHHLALNVLHSGNATVYVDGKAVKTMSASAVPALEGTWLYVGSKGGNTSYFKGTVDEIRFWKASMTGDLLSSQRTQRLTGEEGGLVAYYSFEKLTRDTSTGIISSVNTAADQDKIYNYTTKEYVSAGHEATMTSGTISYTNEAPALKVKPEATNVDFTFVSNERSIIINLDADLDRVEGTTLTFNVRGVKDMNGNESTEIVWTAYVKKNQLLWQGDSELTIEQPNGESTTFEATIVNESGSSENWTLSGLPTWLTASATSGTLKAQSTKTITFTVASSTAIGKYEQTIYLTGNNNISEPLTLNLKVKGEEPDWAVNTSGYQFNMSIVGQLQFQNAISTDEDDIVAAFNDAGECVGVARPQYESAFDTYFTMMTVYGNSNGSLLAFKAYDASTGKIYPVVQTDDDVFFEKDKRIGKLAQPFIWNVTDKIEQTIDLKTGWNWMSLYVTPDDMSPTTVLADALDLLTMINGQNGSCEFDPSFGWGGSLTAMNNASMYKLQASADGTATVVGAPADVVSTTISVKNGMTWIGYPATFTLSLADAFAGLDPEDDDMVKSQGGFAVYSKSNAIWVGTLKAMEPGIGYMYSSTATANKSFNYPSTPPAGGISNAKAFFGEEDVYHFHPVAAQNYPSNMVMIGQVVENGMPASGIEVAAYVGDECRATIRSNADGLVFLLVPGDKSLPLTLRTYIHGDEVTIDLPLTYQSDKMLGTLKMPIKIDITDFATGISRMDEDADDGEYYDLSGRKLNQRPYQPGVYIRNGQKTVVKGK